MALRRHHGGPDAGLRRGGGQGKRAASPSTPPPTTAQDYEVEPDASGASYFMAAAAVTGGRVRIPGLGSSSRKETCASPKSCATWAVGSR